MDFSILTMRLIYGANVVVAGVVGSLSLLVPDVVAPVRHMTRQDH